MSVGTALTLAEPELFNESGGRPISPDKPNRVETFTTDYIWAEQRMGRINESANDIYLVEVKWLMDKVGPGDIAQHVTRVLHRGEGARGLFVSATDYTLAARNTLCEALNYRVHIGMGLQEIIFALEKESDLRQMLRAKVQAAILDKNPLHFVTFS